jgi:hypothetical protein
VNIKIEKSIGIASSPILIFLSKAVSSKKVHSKTRVTEGNLRELHIQASIFWMKKIGLNRIEQWLKIIKILKLMFVSGRCFVNLEFGVFQLTNLECLQEWVGLPGIYQRTT